MYTRPVLLSRASRMDRRVPRLSYAHVVLATGFTVLFFGTGTRYAFGLMLVPMTEDLNLSRSVLSSVLAVFMLVSALAMPFVGRLIDRHSIRVVMAAGAAITALSIGLIGNVNAGWQVFGLYGLLYAVGFAATSVAPISVLMSRWFPNSRGLASSAAITGNGTGQLVIVALLASFLSRLGWRMSYFVLGLANAVVIPLVMLGVRSSPERENEAVASAIQGEAGEPDPVLLRDVFRSKDFWLMIGMYVVCGSQDFFIATHVVAFAQDQGVSQLMAGNVLAFMGLAGLAGVLLSGSMADRMGAVRPTVLCFAVRIGLFAVIPFVHDDAGIATFALLYGFTFTMTAPLTVVFAANIFGTSRLGSVSGLISMVHQIAGGFGALIGAIIFDATGSYNGAFFLMLGLSVIAVAATLMITERLHAPSARTAQ